MQGFIRRGLTAGVLTVAVVAGTGGPATAAIRQPGDDPIERPAPNPPAPTPSQIERFSVSMDSVVATATLQYNGDPSSATVLWGDGTSTSQCPAGQEGPLHSGCMPNPFDSGSAAGTLVLQHRYSAPANGAAFPVDVTAKMGGEQQTVHTGVIPRYRVTVSDTEFSPLSHCDTAAEEETEWRVGRAVHDDAGASIVPYREWNFDHFVTNPRVVVGDWSLPDFEALPGSGFSLELTASDHPLLTFTATELDALFDDQLVELSAGLNPLPGSRSVEVLTHQIDQDYYELGCRAEFHAAVDVHLLEPGLDRGPVLGQ